MTTNKTQVGVCYISNCIITILSLFVFLIFQNQEIVFASSTSKKITCNNNTLDKINEVFRRIEDRNYKEDFENIKKSIDKIEEISTEQNIKIEPIKVSVSAYHMGRTTASGKSVCSGMLAASHDLLKDWTYGSKIILYSKKENGEFEKYGEYVLEDKMHNRWKKSCDIYMTSDGKCRQFGRRIMWAVCQNK